MRYRAIITGCCLFLILSGCVPSLHPLYTDEDIIFKASLLGGWAEKGSKETWVFEKSGNRAYKLTYTDEEDKRGEFLAHLVKVGGHMFLDLFPDGPHLEESAFYVIHLVPAHTFIHVKQIKPTLQMRMLDPEWFEDFLQEHPEAVKHEQLEDRKVLTAKPKELQAFLVKHLATEDAFTDFSNMQPVRAAYE